MFCWEPNSFLLNWRLITKIMTITGVVLLCHFLLLLLLAFSCICVQTLQAMQQLFFFFFSFLVIGLAKESRLGVLPFFWVVPLTSAWAVFKHSGGLSSTCFRAQETNIGGWDTGHPCFACRGKRRVCTWGTGYIKSSSYSCMMQAFRRWPLLFLFQFLFVGARRNFYSSCTFPRSSNQAQSQPVAMYIRSCVYIMVL